jgi:membrane-associated phospholipid phosphatase
VFKKLLLILFLLSQISAHAQNWDIDLLKDINLNRNRDLDPAAIFISNTVLPISLLVPTTTGSIGIYKKDNILTQKGITMAVAIAFNSLSTYALKTAINRERPAETYSSLQPVVDKKGHSFPSGHTSNAFCTATSLSLNFRKWYVIVPAYAWAATVAYARMDMGVHYPSDVLAGAVLGVGSSWITYKVNKYYSKKYQEKYILNHIF